jgi:hypothetical protein
MSLVRKPGPSFAIPFFLVVGIGGVAVPSGFRLAGGRGARPPATA